jgi:AraC-like DNA-binding protein
MNEKHPHRLLDPDNLITIRRLPEHESGILDKSDMYLHLPSKFARQSLFFAPYIGRFYCNSSYIVSRDNFDYYLFLFVDDGILHISLDGKEYLAGPNDTVILNCKKPHIYYTKEKVSFYFFHFDGLISSQLYDLIISQQDTVIHTQNPIIIMNTVTAIFTMAENGYANELKISALIHGILSDLVSQNIQTYDYASEIVTKAVKFMEQHFVENISVKKIAESVFLGEYHFSHLFREHANISPYAYILRLRMIYACQLLEGSTFPIKMVGDKCGFNSVQHFIRSFSKNMRCSPSQYRKKIVCAIAGNVNNKARNVACGIEKTVLN